MSRQVTVTGGAGFIGSHLVEYLVNEDHEVTVVDDLSTGQKENLTPFMDEIEFFDLDIRSDKMDDILEGTEWLFHQAAIPSVARSFEIPVESTSVNILGTVNLFEKAIKNDVDKIVYASSSSVYGDTEELPKVETMETNPKSPYAVCKITAELFSEVFSDTRDLNVTGLRYFNVFGPRQDPNTDYAAVIPNFITALLSGEVPVIFGDGEQSRDFTYVKDVVNANIAAVKSGESGKVYNVGYNQQLTINDLLYELRKITGSQIDPRYDSPRPGDVRHSRANSEKLLEDTSFDPDYSVEEGLRETVEWFKNHKNRWKDT